MRFFTHFLIGLFTLILSNGTGNCSFASFDTEIPSFAGLVGLGEIKIAAGGRQTDEIHIFDVFTKPMH